MFLGGEIRGIVVKILPMAQVLDPLREGLGLVCAVTGEPCKATEHDGEPPASRHRRSQVL